MTRHIPRTISTPAGRTTIRMEPEFMEAMTRICEQDAIPFPELVKRAQSAYPEGGRSSALRCFTTRWLLDAVPAPEPEQAAA